MTCEVDVVRDSVLEIGMLGRFETRVGKEYVRSDKNEHYKKRQSEIRFGSDANCI